MFHGKIYVDLVEEPESEFEVSVNVDARGRAEGALCDAQALMQSCLRNLDPSQDHRVLVVRSGVRVGPLHSSPYGHTRGIKHAAHGHYLKAEQKGGKSST